MADKQPKNADDSKESTGSETKKVSAQPTKPLKCGIIMPIADNPDLGYPLGHWGQVRDIIIGAAVDAGFEADMVSNDTQVDLIHATIIKNIYANDVAVCDVSSRNPNVMFELGLRIASKKPVILIKDESTPFSFDTQLIPHLAYRRDLRLYETLEFQKQLRDKIRVAHEEAQQEGYKSFLEQFTSYTLAQIDEQQVGVPEYLLRVANQMQSLEDVVKQLSSTIGKPASSTPAAVRTSGVTFAGGGKIISHSQTLTYDINKSIDKFLQENNMEKRFFATTESLVTEVRSYVLKNNSDVAQFISSKDLDNIIANYLKNKNS